MDITVTRAVNDEKAWDLTDLLGRPVGRVAEEPGKRFFIRPDRRAHESMSRANLGPHESLNDAFAAVEKWMHGVCRFAGERQP